MNLSELLDSPFCVHLTLTLAHFLWQGVVIAALAAGASWCLRGASAQSRYLIHVTALLLMVVVCLPVTFAVVRATVPVSASPPPEQETIPKADEAIAEIAVARPADVIEPPVPFVEPRPNSFEPFQTPDGTFEPSFAPYATETESIASQQESESVAEEEEPAAAAQAAGFRWQVVTPYATGVYFAGVFVMLVRLWLALQGGRRLRRRSRPVDDPSLLEIVKQQARLLGLRFLPAVAYCERVAVPVVIGVLRPMILLPVSLATGLAPDQFRAILTHELIHLRRYDHLVNILQRVIEAVLFFHPAAWYVSWRINVEREHCCDDAVVGTGQQRAEYAESLIRVAELSLLAQTSGRSYSCAALGATGGNGSRLRERILRLIDGHSHEKLHLRRTWPIAFVLIAAALAATSLLMKVRAEPAGEKQAEETEAGAVDADVARALVAKLRNDDVTFGVGWGGTSLRKLSATAEAVLELGDRAVPALVEALDDTNRFAAAHVLLTLIVDDKLKPENLNVLDIHYPTFEHTQWRGLQVKFHADNRQEVFPGQIPDLKELWRKAVSWGKPLGGIRAGVSPARIALVGKEKKFEVVVEFQNVSGGELEIPVPSGNSHCLIYAIEKDGKTTFQVPPKQPKVNTPLRIPLPHGDRTSWGVGFAFPPIPADDRPFAELPELKIGESVTVRVGWNERRTADAAASWNDPKTIKSGRVVAERIAPPPPPPLAKMASEADRIVVVRWYKERLSNEHVLEVLKGDSSSASDQQPRLTWGARTLPAHFEKMILFLRVEADGRGVPQLRPVDPAHWFVPYSKETAEKVRDLIPLPKAWGPAVGDLQMGLRVRKDKFAAGEDIPVEICIRNVGKKRVSLSQHRYNIYDYYQHTRLTVIGPDGTRWELAKPAGTIDESDLPSARTLEPGEVYIHTVRLDKWPLKGESFKPASSRRPNPLTQPGRYRVRCDYSVSEEFAAPLADVHKTGSLWHGKLVSNDLTVEVLPAETSLKPLLGDRVDVDGLRTALRDVETVRAVFRKKLPADRKGGPLPSGTFRVDKFGDEYGEFLIRYVVLDRPGQGSGPPPDQWVARLLAVHREGFRLEKETLWTHPEVLRERLRLLQPANPHNVRQFVDAMWEQAKRAGRPSAAPSSLEETARRGLHPTMAKEFTQAGIAALYADGNYAMMLADPVEFPKRSGQRRVYFVELHRDARQAQWFVRGYGTFSTGEQAERVGIFLARHPQATLVAGRLPDGTPASAKITVTETLKASFDAAEMTQAHARTISDLLPAGWTVKADGDVVTIRRNEKVQGDYASPVASWPNEIAWCATIQVRVGPRISMARYCRMASENETARKEALARHPNYDPVDNPIRLPHSLPTHLDDQSSLWISGGYLDKMWFTFKSKDAAEECRRVYESIKGSFRPYTPGFSLWGLTVNGLQAGLDLERPAEAANGKLRLLFRLRNVSEKPVRVLRLSAQARRWGENLPIEVIDIKGGRKVMKYRGPVLESPQPPFSQEYVQLAPGEIDSVEVEMNPAHWGIKDLSKVYAAFIFSNANEKEGPGPGWPVITGLWTGQASSRRILLAPGTPKKPENPKSAGVMQERIESLPPKTTLTAAPKTPDKEEPAWGEAKGGTETRAVPTAEPTELRPPKGRQSGAIVVGRETANSSVKTAAREAPPKNSPKRPLTYEQWRAHQAEQGKAWMKKLSPPLEKGKTWEEIESALAKRGITLEVTGGGGCIPGPIMETVSFGLTRHLDLTVKFDGRAATFDEKGIVLDKKTVILSYDISPCRYFGAGDVDDLRDDVKPDHWQAFRLLATTLKPGYYYDPVELVRTVNTLQALGEKGAYAVIDEYMKLFKTDWKRARYYGLSPDRLSSVLRLLFVGKDGKPNVPEIEPIASGIAKPTEDDPAWPLWPLIVQDGLPLYAFAPGELTRSGNSISIQKHLDYVKKHCRLREGPIVPTADPLTAANRLTDSEQWKELFAKGKVRDGRVEWTRYSVRRHALRAMANIYPVKLTKTVTREIPTTFADGTKEEPGQVPADFPDDVWQKHVRAVRELKPVWDAKRNEFVAGQQEKDSGIAWDETKDDVEIAEKQVENQPESKDLTITLKKESSPSETPSYWIEGKRLDKDALRERVSRIIKADPKRQVIVRVDKSMQFEHVVEVISLLKAVGTTNMKVTSPNNETAAQPTADKNSKAAKGPGQPGRVSAEVAGWLQDLRSGDPAAPKAADKEKIAWGEAKDGIRAGLSPVRITFAGKKKRLDAVIIEFQNVSGGELEIPVPSGNAHCLIFAIEKDGKTTFHMPPKQLGVNTPMRVREPHGDRTSWGVSFAFPSSPGDDRPLGVLPELKIGESVTLRMGWNEHRTADAAASWNDPKTIKSGRIVVERIAPPPPPPLAKMAGEADRIVVVRWYKERLSNEHVLEVLKGDSSAASDQQPRLSLDARTLPARFERMILFLRVEADGRGVPQLHPVDPAHWFVPYSKETAEKVRDLIPLPKAWGPAVGDLQMGLRVRKEKFFVGQDVPLEICIRNVGKKRVSLLQHRYNVYDYYQHTRLIVTGPDGTRWELAKPAGTVDGLDVPSARTLEPGEVYIHTVRLEKWPLEGESFKPAPSRRPNPLTQPGRYTVRCDYSVSEEFAAPLADVHKTGSLWHGKLASNDLTVEVLPVKTGDADASTSPVQSEFEDFADFLQHFQPKIPDQWRVSWLLHRNIGPSRGTSRQGVLMRLCRPHWMYSLEKPGSDSTILPQTTPKIELPQKTPAIEPDAHVAIMSEGYKGKAPQTEEMGPARELAKWRGRRVFVWEDRTNWPGMEADILAAFKAADKGSVAAKATPLSGLCRDVAALLGELEPRLPAKWDVYEVEPITFSLDQRLFRMAFVHQDKRELYGHSDGAYLDLDTLGVPESVARDGGNVPLATWRGRKIYLPRVGRGWPTHKADVLAALRASDADAGRVTNPALHTGPWGESIGGLRMGAWGKAGDPILWCLIRNHGSQPVRYSEYELGYFESVSLVARPVGAANWTKLPRVKKSRYLASAGGSYRDIHVLGVGENMPLHHNLPKVKAADRPYTFSVDLADFQWPKTWRGKLEVVVMQAMGALQAEAPKGTWTGTLSSPPVVVSMGQSPEQRTSPAAVQPTWGNVASGLQSRIVLPRTTFKQGQPIVADVLVRNVSDKPIPYNLRMAGHDALSGCSRFQVIGPDGLPVPDISRLIQVGMHFDEKPLPQLKPGETRGVYPERLDTHHYMRVPGRYRITWKGLPSRPSDSEMERIMRPLHSDGAAEEPPKGLAPSLPPSGTLEIEVVPAPGGGPDRDMVGRLLKILPPGWKVNGAKLVTDVCPTLRTPGRGSEILLVHRPVPGTTANVAWVGLYVMDELSVVDKAAAAIDADYGPAMYLGKGPLGHVYFDIESNRFGALARWSYVAQDVAAALGVIEPRLQEPAGPDWGRVVSRILFDCYKESEKHESLQRFCRRSKLTTGGNRPLDILYRINTAVPPDAGKVEFTRDDPEQPYYYVRVNVEPIPPGESQQAMRAVDKSIRWDGKSDARGYVVERLGVQIRITVASDDVGFRMALNAILDREINRVLAEGGGSANAPRNTQTKGARAAGAAIAFLEDGSVRCRFTAEEVAGVCLTAYDKSRPSAVPATLWPAFAAALGSARRLPPGIPLAITQGEAVLLVLKDGRQIYLEGQGGDWMCHGGGGKRAGIRCAALGRAVAKATGNLKTAGAGPVVPALTRALQGRDGRVGCDAADTLGKLGDPRAVPPLIVALEAGSAGVRHNVAVALGKLGDKRAIVPLIASLEDDHEPVCWKAAGALAQIDPAAVPEKAIAILIRALKNSGARYDAAQSLGKLGPAAKAAVPALIDAAKDPYWPTRANVINALASVAPAEEAIPVLIRALKDESRFIRASAATALGRIGPRTEEVVPAILQATEDGDIFVRNAATVALGNIGAANKEVVRALIRALGDTGDQVRTHAAEALGKLGPAVGEAPLPALREALNDRDKEVRQAAAEALKRIQPNRAATQPAEAAAEVLGLTLPVQVTEANLISDGGTTAMRLVDAGNRTLHVFMDGRKVSGPSPPPRHLFTGAYPGKEGSKEQPMGGRTEQAVLALLQAWMDRQADPERQARLRVVQSVVGLSDEGLKLLRVIRVIGKLSTRAQPATQPAEADAEFRRLIGQLKGSDWRLRSAAAKTLGEMGPKAAPAVPALMQVLEGIKARAEWNARNDEGAANIIWALGQIGEPAVPRLIQAVEKGQSPLRERAVGILQEIGPQAKAAAPALAAILRNDTEPLLLRGQAATALGAIRSADPEVVATLVSALTAKQWQLRERAAKALGEIGPPAELCVPALAKALTEPDSDVNRAAADALGKMAAKSDKALAPLLKVIRDTDLEEHKRARAVNGLVQMGPAAEKVLPNLIAALGDNSANVRVRAAEVLTHLGPRAKDAVPALVARLKDDQWWVRQEAVRALGAIGPAAKSAEEALRASLNDRMKQVRDAAAEALQRIAPTAPATQPAGLNLDAAAKTLTEKAGGKWEKHDHPHFGLILECHHEQGKYGGSYLVLQLPVEEAAKALQRHPYDFDVAVGIIGSNDRCTVIEAAVVPDPKFGAGIVKALKLTAASPPARQPADGSTKAQEHAGAARASVGTLLAEAETLRKESPEQWAQWDQAVAGVLDKHAAMVRGWGGHARPPAPDVAPLKLPMAYLVWHWKDVSTDQRLLAAGKLAEMYLRAIADSGDERRIDILLQIFGGGERGGKLLAKAMTAERAEPSIRELLAGAPKLGRDAPLHVLLREFAGALSPEVRKASYDWLRSNWAQGPSNGDGEQYWETLFRLDLDRARGEVIGYYGQRYNRSNRYGLYVLNLLLAHGGPSEQVANAVRRWRKTPDEFLDFYRRRVLVCADPEGELEGYVADIEAQFKSGQRPDELPYLVRALVEHIPRQSVKYLRQFANDRRLTGLMGEGTRKQIVRWLVEQQDEQAEKIVARWLAEEDQYAQRHLIYILTRQGEFARGLLKKVRPGIELPPLPAEKASPTQPARLDHQRMWERILAACADLGKDQPALAALRAGARSDHGNKELAAWKYESNVVIDWDRQPMACTRKDPQQPYYYVRMSIRPMHTGPSDVSADSPSIAWDGKSSQRSYGVKRLGVAIGITVLSDDAEFAKAINAILDKEVTRALRRSAPPAAQPADGSQIELEIIESGAIFIGGHPTSLGPVEQAIEDELGKGVKRVHVVVQTAAPEKVEPIRRMIARLNDALKRQGKDQEVVLKVLPAAEYAVWKMRRGAAFGLANYATERPIFDNQAAQKNTPEEILMRPDKATRRLLFNLLDDRKPIPLRRSMSPHYVRYKYRVCDYAMFLLIEVLGEKPGLALSEDPKERDRRVAELKSKAEDVLRSIPRATPAGGDEVSWGKPVDGLRCGWVRPAGPAVAGTAPEVAMRVENVGKGPAVFGFTLAVGLSSPSYAGEGHLSTFLSPRVTCGPNARPATVREVRTTLQIETPQLKDHDPLDGYYHVKPGAQLTLRCGLSLDSPSSTGIRTGHLEVDSILYRDCHPLFDDAKAVQEADKLRCPPLMLEVVEKDASGKRTEATDERAPTLRSSVEQLISPGTYREVLHVDEPIVDTLGRTPFPAGLLVGSGDELTAVVLGDNRIIRRISAKESRCEVVGASNNGGLVAALARQQEDGRDTWHLSLSSRQRKATAKGHSWELSPLDNFDAPSATKVQVSDDGNTILLVDNWHRRSEGHDPGVRTLGRNGQLLGELKLGDGGGYDANRWYLTSDGAMLFVPEYRLTPDGVRYGFVALDRNLDKSWSFDLKDQDLDCVTFAVNERAKRLAVCGGDRLECWLLDFSGKVLFEFKSNCGFPRHPRMDEAGKTIVVSGGCGIELHEVGKSGPLWTKNPPTSPQGNILRGYDVSSADISPDGRLVVASYHQWRPEFRTAPRFVVVYDRAGKLVCQRTFDGKNYTTACGLKVAFTGDGRSIVVQEEKAIGVLQFAK